jgi:hypothetical protein
VHQHFLDLLKQKSEAVPAHSVQKK